MRSNFLKRSAEADPELSYTDFRGIPITLEWRKGEVRTGTNPEGESWEKTMGADYGFIPGTVAAGGDGEDLDVYLGDNPDAPNVYVIEQLDENDDFDEFKAFLGFDSEEEAVRVFKLHFPPDWNIVGDVWTITVDRLKELLEDHGIGVSE